MERFISAKRLSQFPLHSSLKRKKKNKKINLKKKINKIKNNNKKIKNLNNKLKRKKLQQNPKRSKKTWEDFLPAINFNFYDYKTLFTNAPDKREALKQLWSQWQPEGLSLWFVHY